MEQKPSTWCYRLNLLKYLTYELRLVETSTASAAPTTIPVADVLIPRAPCVAAGCLALGCAGPDSLLFRAAHGGLGVIIALLEEVKDAKLPLVTVINIDQRVGAQALAIIEPLGNTVPRGHKHKGAENEKKDD